MSIIHISTYYQKWWCFIILKRWHSILYFALNLLCSIFYSSEKHFSVSRFWRLSVSGVRGVASSSSLVGEYPGTTVGRFVVLGAARKLNKYTCSAATLRHILSESSLYSRRGFFSRNFSPSHISAFSSVYIYTCSHSFLTFSHTCKQRAPSLSLSLSL